MKYLLAAAVALMSTTAPAVTYDAFAAFDGANAINGPFRFGSVTGGTYADFPAGGTCLLTNVICRTSGNYLGVYKTFDGQAHPGSGTVDVPGNALILHPGQYGEVAGIFFTAPVSGVYTVTLNAFQATNTNANSMNLIGYNGLGTSPFGFVTLTAASPSYSYSQPGLFLSAGQTIGLGVDHDGDYSYDSTGVNFTLDLAGAVPEPATWGMMLLGFGMVGMGARRRRALPAAA